MKNQLPPELPPSRTLTLEEMLDDPLSLGNWESTFLAVSLTTLQRIKEGRLATPVEVLFESASGDVILRYRVKAFEPKSMEIIESIPWKWQENDIYPLKVEISDENQVETWKADPNLERVQ